MVFLIGSFGFIIAAFRVGIGWGLSCMFLPIVSLVFLIVHWKVAAKPLFVSLLGIGISFSGTLLVPTGEAVQNIRKYKPPTTVGNKKKYNQSFQCSGKILSPQLSRS